MTDSSGARPTEQTIERTTVLVTGGTGHLGGHTVARLLRSGYRVRTTIRTKDREAEVLAMLAEAGLVGPERLELAVADLSSDVGWPEATSGVDRVLHVASPFPSSAPKDDADVIVPARDGALRVLRAARDSGVTRVVMTSSFAAVGYSRRSDEPFTEEDWTDPDDDNSAYVRSKAIAERAAWQFVAAEGDQLELTVVNPTGIFGPLLSNHLSTSVGLVRAILDGAMPVVPRTFFGVVDVRDVADLHVLAMTSAAAAGQRFIATSGESSSLFGLAQVLRRHLGAAGWNLSTVELSDEQVREAAERDPSLRETVGRLGQHPVINNHKARTVLGWAPRSADSTIIDTADSLIRRGLVSRI